MSGSNLRSKLEAFFTPGPKNQAAKGDFDPEDPVDLYNHTAKFFKPNKKTDDYAKQIEVGERRIRSLEGPLEELDQKVYGGKRVSL